MLKGYIVPDSWVTIYDMDLEEKFTYHILPQSHKKENENDLLYDTPLAQALLHHVVEEIVTVKAEIEYNVKILDVDPPKTNVIPKAVSEQQSYTNQLARNLYKGLGTCAQAVYIDCCKKFNWDYSQKNLFGMLQPLFAPKATPENYAVIFLAHSNWTKSKKTKLNVIQEQTIEERWEIVDNNDFDTDHYTRVVFAKNPSCKGNYVFLGVYEYKDTKTETYPNGQTLHVKIYNRISDVYPF